MADQKLEQNVSQTSPDAATPEVAPAAAPPSPLFAHKIYRRLQRRHNGDGVQAGADAAVQRAVGGGGGAALPAETRSKFEGSTGASLGDVRVHTGAESQAAASSVGARAFTLGNDIHFNAGQYDPGSSAGEHLLAHEVAHTQQQRGGASGVQHKLEVSSPGDSAEVAADHAADAMVAGTPTKIAGVGAGKLARKEEGESVGQKTIAAGESVADDVRGDVRTGAKETKKAPPPGKRFGFLAKIVTTVASLLKRGVMGSHQISRIEPALDKMSDDDYLKVKHLVEHTSPLYAKMFLLKAVAAGNTVADIEWLAGQIAGKDGEWLVQNCTLGDTQMKGTGTKQQYSHTCGVTTVQTIRGEYDPVYALKLRQGNTNISSVDDSDATKVNPAMAAEQKQMTESTYGGTAFGAHAGVTANRDNAAAGGGRWVDDKLNAIKTATGLTFTTKLDPTAEEANSILKDKLGKGMQTPTVIGNGAGQYTHYVLGMHKRTKNSQVEFQFHDPWDAKTVWRSTKDVTDGVLDIAGSNKITALEVPSA